MLDSKVLIITGAKGGLGTFVTEACLNAGAKVAGVSRSINDNDFRRETFRAVPAELTSGDAAHDVVQKTIETFGRVDGLIHVLGGYAGGSSVADTEDTTVMQMLQLNFLSAFWMIKAIVPHLRNARAGHIVAVGSRAAIESSPMSAAYASSKAALVSLIRATASENAGQCISANVVLPGTLDTPGNRKAMPDADFSRWVNPAHVANLIVALVADGLSNVSGAAIPIYGREQ